MNEIERLKQLARESTPGPWVADERVGCVAVYPAEVQLKGCIDNGKRRLVYFDGYRDEHDFWQVKPEDSIDAAYIAAAIREGKS